MGERVVIAAERVELAHEDPELRAEKLQERQVHEGTGGVTGLGQDGDDVGGYERPGGIVDAVPEVGHAHDSEEAARPQSQLLRVDVQGVLGEAAVLGEILATADSNALGNLEEVDIHHDALLSHLVAQSEPVTGQPGAVPEAAAPGGRDIHGLGSRRARQHHHRERYADRPARSTHGVPFSYCAAAVVKASKIFQPRFDNSFWAVGVNLPETKRTFSGAWRSGRAAAAP